MDVTTMFETTETSQAYVPVTIDDGARIAFITVGAAMVLSGVLGNFLLLVVIFQQFNRKSSVHILFVANLSLADLLTLGYWFTFFVLDLILHRHPVVDRVHCVINGVVIITLYLTCISFLVSISLNRYLHVCHSRLYSRVFTLPRTVAWCLVVWLGSLFVAILPIVDQQDKGSYGYSRVTRFCSYSRGGTSYVKIIVLTYAILPMLFVAYCNFAIFRRWRQLRLSSIKRYPPMKNEEESRREKGLNKLQARVNKGKASAGAGDTMDRAEEHVTQGENEDPGITEHGAKANTNVGDRRDDGGVRSKTATPIQKHCRISEDTEDELSKADDELIQQGAGDQAENEKASSPSQSSVPLTGNSEEDNEDTIKTGWTTAATQSDLDGNNTVRVATDGQPALAHALDITPDQPTEQIEENAEVSAAGTSSAMTPSKRQKQQHKTAGQESTLLKTAKRRGQIRDMRHKAREVAFVRSLFVVFLLAVGTFIPYSLMTILKSYMDFSAELVILGNFFLFLNNSVNWIVYGVMNPTFRQGYVQNVRKTFAICCSVKCNKTREEQPAAASSLMMPSVQRSNTLNDVSLSSTSQTSPEVSGNGAGGDDTIITRC
ncbi:probable G-protein coupled receptor No9 [Littorina saxatilis]|uniref:G-protein coupled receptors family 1 profile domain-containing protein n=1 Tax=Littorina saxatilis TaxID=31220 RepID=A0AAN9AIR7_9CAEN